MTFSLSVLGGLLAAGFFLSRVKARSDSKPNVQKLFSAR